MVTRKSTTEVSREQVMHSGLREVVGSLWFIFLLILTLFGLACSGFCCMSRRGHDYTRVSTSSDWVSYGSVLGPL
jgi:hypothetical protein